MKTSDFLFDLPESQIAQTPIEPRDHSRMMCINRATGAISHEHFYNVIDHLQQMCIRDRMMPMRKPATLKSFRPVFCPKIWMGRFRRRRRISANGRLPSSTMPMEETMRCV